MRKGGNAMDRHAGMKGAERPNRAPTWKSWLLVALVAALLSALTTIGLECLFRHGPGGSGCLSGACGGKCGSAGSPATTTGEGHGAGHGRVER
jgi:hypothetical protein